MLVFTLAAATFMFTGPVGRGTGRELGAWMAASAPGPDTVIVRTQTSAGVEEDIFAQLDSEENWQMLAGAGARLLLMRDEGNKRVTIEQVLSREAALRAAAGAAAAGTYLYLQGSILEERVNNLMRGRNNVAYGLEVETARALEASESAKKEFGPLTAVNDARSVIFFQKGKPGTILLEADGLCLNSKLLVLLEAKAAPTSFDVDGLTKNGFLLKGILASPDKYETNPSDIKQQLEEFRDVRLVLGGYHFQKHVEKECLETDPPIWIICTAGKAFGVHGPDGPEPQGI